MTPRLDNDRRELKERAAAFRQKARAASTPALREYYWGRADEAQTAADLLTKHLTNPTYDHEHTDQRSLGRKPDG
jgi:hypothetical protein